MNGARNIFDKLRVYTTFVVINGAICSIYTTLENRKLHLEAYASNITKALPASRSYTSRISTVTQTSNNYIPANDIDFNFERYKAMRDDVNCLDYLSNIDMIVHSMCEANKNHKWDKLHDIICYFITKRKYQIYGFSGFCLGMSCTMIKAMLTNNVKSIHFENGPDPVSISYQIMSRRRFTGKIKYLQRTGLQPMSICSNGFDGLHDGVYLITTQTTAAAGHAMALSKHGNRVELFDPNVGVLRISISQVIKYTAEHYGLTDVTVYEMRLK